MNEITKLTHFVNHLCNDNCETCDIKCNYYEIVKQLYDAGYRLQSIDFITNEEVQIDDIVRIIRTSYSLSPRMSDAAKAIYNSGYRKLSDNIVVMSKDDLKLYKRSIVEELIEKLKNKACRGQMYNGDPLYCININDAESVIKEYLK